MVAIAGSKYYLRTDDTIGFILVSFYDGYLQKIDFGCVGGGSGLFNIRPGAGDKDEGRILEEIKRAAQSIGAIVS